MKQQKKKLNIALFTDAFYPMLDGVITVVNHYARILKDRANVFVVAPRRKGHVDNLDYEVVRCKSVKVPLIGYDYAMPGWDRKFKKEMAKRDIDIIHIHSPFNVGKMGTKIAKKRNIPVVATMHSQFKQDFQRAVKSKVIVNALLRNIMRTYNACDEVWAVNENTQEVLKGYGYKKQSYVMRSGTEMLPVDKEQATKDVCKLHNIDPKCPIFLFVGRMILQKNILFIAEALKVIKDQGVPFKMIYVGVGMDLERTREKVKELGIEDDVIFVDKQITRDLLIKYYASSKLVLFPSVYDTDGLVKYEGASQHVPTVLMEGIAAISGLTNDHNAFISKPTPQDFAEKIMQVLKDKELYKKVSENAYKELYRTWEQKIDDAYNRYLYLIEQKKQQVESSQKKSKKDKKQK